MPARVRDESTRDFMTWLARRVEEWKNMAEEMERAERLSYYSGKVREWIKEAESILDTSGVAKA